LLQAFIKPHIHWEQPVLHEASKINVHPQCAALATYGMGTEHSQPPMMANRSGYSQMSNKYSKLDKNAKINSNLCSTGCEAVI